MALAHSPKIVTDGLVLCLDAANVKSYPGIGTTWYDISGNGKSGTLTNGPTYSTANGGSIVFDGVNDCIDLNTNNIVTGTNPFTVEIFYTITTATGAELFGNYGGAGYGTNTLWISGRYGVWINSQMPYFVGAPLGLGTYHLTFSRSAAGECILYKNGVQNATASNLSSIPVGTNFRIGTDVNGSGEPFGGNLYNLKVYNRALSPTEIQQNFNALRGRYGL